MTNLILFVVAVVLAVVLGTKTKVNMGVWAYLFALLLGLFRCNLSVAKVIAKFPTGNFYIFIIAAMFYAFGQVNGTISLLAQKLVYKFRNQTKLGPIVLLLIASVISVSGSNGTTGLILTGMIYPFAAAMDMNVLPCLVAVHVAAGGLGKLPWTSAGANDYAVFAQYQNPDAAMGCTYIATLVVTLLLLAGMVVTGIKTGAFKKKDPSKSKEFMEEPPEYTPVQKKTLRVIVIALLCIVIPIALKTIIPTPFTKRLASVVCLQTVWTVGIIVQALMNLGDLKEIIAKKVPWNTIILVTGMCTMFGLASDLGIVDMFGNFVSTVPKILVLPCIAAVTSILSFFVSGVIIAPLFAPMIGALSAGTGIAPILLMAAVISGGSATSISPLSAGGAYLLSGAPDGEIKSKASAGLAKVAIVNVFAMFLIYLVIGLFN